MSNWDLMHSTATLPHYSVGHRLVTSWVQPAWVGTIDWQLGANVVDETIRLQPIETGEPTSGRKSAAEIRIADGRNYYFEFRASQAGQIGDRDLPASLRVVGEEMLSYRDLGDWFDVLGVRAPILLLPSNADGPVLGLGQEYREPNTTDPTFPAGLVVTVTALNATEASIRIQSNPNVRPDPSIRPAPRNCVDCGWRSEDIEIANTRSLLDPAWKDVPMWGSANEVSAWISNETRTNAPAVHIELEITELNPGPSNPMLVFQATADVPAESTVKVPLAYWYPEKANTAYSLKVRILDYTVPNTAVTELTTSNNQAVSNYDRAISDTASPSRRQIRTMTLTNVRVRRRRVSCERRVSVDL